MSLKKVLSSAVVLACIGLLGVVAAEAQPCQRLQCLQSNQCQSKLFGAEGGPCCCRVQCAWVGGTLQCTCTTWCARACNTDCPGNCDSCDGGPLAFLVTPEANAQVGQQHALAAQVLSNLSDGLSHPVSSRIAQGRSNVEFWYEYLYKVRIIAAPDHAVMEFVFEHPEGHPTPSPVRLMIDQSGQVLASPLSPEDAENLRAEAATACSEPAVAETESPVPLDPPAED